MQVKGMDRVFIELVRPPKPDEIRCNDPVPGFDKDRDHLSIQIAPGRLAVQAKPGHIRVRRTLIDIVHTTAENAREIVKVVRREREIGKVAEPIIRRSKSFHAYPIRVVTLNS